MVDSNSLKSVEHGPGDSITVLNQYEEICLKSHDSVLALILMSFVCF